MLCVDYELFFSFSVSLLSRTVLHLCSSSKTNLKRQKILKESKANLKKQKKTEVMIATDSDEYFGFDDFDGCDLCGGPGKVRSRRPIDIDKVSFELYH
ncbi:hypothetical protein YC2023_109315 [Brassica napus]